MAASKRGVTQMDDKFADRMAELGDISGGMLTSRWEAVVGIANVASAHQKARLVLMGLYALKAGGV